MSHKSHKYKASGGRVDFLAFSGRSHYICGETGWEEVADAALALLSEVD